MYLELHSPVHSVLFPERDECVGVVLRKVAEQTHIKTSVSEGWQNKLYLNNTEEGEGGGGSHREIVHTYIHTYTQAWNRLGLRVVLLLLSAPIPIYSSMVRASHRGGGFKHKSIDIN